MNVKSPRAQMGAPTIADVASAYTRAIVLDWLAASA